MFYIFMILGGMELLMVDFIVILVIVVIFMGGISSFLSIGIWEMVLCLRSILRGVLMVLRGSFIFFI